MLSPAFDDGDAAFAINSVKTPQMKNSGVWLELAITANDVCGEERLADAVVG